MQKAAPAGAKLLALAGVFPESIAAQLKTTMAVAEIVQTTPRKVKKNIIDTSSLTEQEQQALDATLTELCGSKLFESYYEHLQQSGVEYKFINKSQGMGAGSFNPTTKEIGGYSNPYVVAQELFHAYQNDLNIYSQSDGSVIETEGDLIAIAIAVAANVPGLGAAWDQGIPFDFVDESGMFDERVLTPEFDALFNKAVEARIEFYRNDRADAESPFKYTQKNSGVGALAIKKLVIGLKNKR